MRKPADEGEDHAQSEQPNTHRPHHPVLADIPPPTQVEDETDRQRRACGGGEGHELVHVANPNWSEAGVVRKTDRQWLATGGRPFARAQSGAPRLPNTPPPAGGMI